MNRKIQIITSIFILLIMLGIHTSYAISGSNNNFFTVTLDKIEQKETLNISFNLNKIEYDNFKIVLNSNIDNSQIYTDNNITVKEESNAVVIEIDKTKMNLGSIEMFYLVPEETEANTQIQLSVKVIIQEETEQKDDEENTIIEKQEKTILEENKNITVIEKQENENQESTKPNDEKQEQNADTNKNQYNNLEENNKDSINKLSDSKNNNSMTNMEKSNNNNNSKSVNINSTSKNTNSNLVQSNKNVEMATYNGSNNNYLKNLKVKGVDLNTNFNKENSTYFIKVTDTYNIKLTATVEDSKAKVTVIGNDNIKEGTNKVLITVTAENGDTRYYRIFVNCEIDD